MKIAKILLTVTLALILSIGFVGCNKQEPDTRVAATVNGTEIMEFDVTTRIEFLRMDQSTGEPMDDVTWATLLATNNFTPESLREYVIRYQFAFTILLLQKAEAVGIAPDTEAIDASIAEDKVRLENAGASFDLFLAANGLASEEVYRRILEADDIMDAVAAEMIDKTQPPQEDIDTYISENAANFAGKYLYIITFPSNNEDPELAPDVVKAQAEAARVELLHGTPFDAVAKKYMKDPELAYLADIGGEVGWDYNYYVEKEIVDALNSLGINEISDVIEVSVEQAVPMSEEEESLYAEDEDYVQPTELVYTYYLAKYTDDFTLTTEEYFEPVDVSKVPQYFVDMLTEEYVSAELANRQNQFFLDLVASDEIIINPMPTDLPYIVDMSLAIIEEEPEDDTDTTEQEPDWINPFEGEEIPDPVFDKNNLGISDMLEGTGLEAKKGDVVEVHYIGYFEDGTVFDSSFERGEPFPVTIGAGGVIEGWELGLVGMKVGGHRFLSIPPELGYGSIDYYDIPANSTLFFNIELVSVNGDSTGYPADGTQ